MSHRKQMAKKASGGRKRGNGDAEIPITPAASKKTKNAGGVIRRDPMDDDLITDDEDWGDETYNEARDEHYDENDSQAEEEEDYDEDAAAAAK